MVQKLLCLSNGHGEDAIALPILQQLQQLKPSLEIAVLPLVGEGKAYLNSNFRTLGPLTTMPSGGFIYMDGRQLWQDLKGGLLSLTWAQYQTFKAWVKQNQHQKPAILAVGDILPLGLAWLSGLNYAFIGTAKSEYYWRDEEGYLQSTTWWQRQSGSIYFPWERWLMTRPQCRGVYPRDQLTATILAAYNIPVFDCGNPMVDGVAQATGAPRAEMLTILLLPGSRIPEALNNWEKILASLPPFLANQEPLLFLAAIAPTLDFSPLIPPLLAQGWELQPRENLELEGIETTALIFQQQQATLILTQQAYSLCLQWADLAIAMAGTATEQFVGLGKPVFALPGKGPQYTRTFAENQSRLLGPSLILVEEPTEIALLWQSLSQDRDRLAKIAANGKKRLGPPGAAQRIAQSLLTQLQ